MRIPAAAAAALFLLTALGAASADLYTDEYVISQTKEDIVKLRKLLPSKSANGVTLMDVTYTEPEKGASGNGSITYLMKFDSIRKKDIPDLETFSKSVRSARMRAPARESSTASSYGISTSHLMERT